MESQFDRLQHIDIMFSHCADERTDDGEIMSSCLGAQAAGVFLLKLYHSDILFGLIVGERDSWIGKKSQNTNFMLFETQE